MQKATSLLSDVARLVLWVILIVGLTVASVSFGILLADHDAAHMRGECNYSFDEQMGTYRVPPHISGDSDPKVTLGLAVSAMKDNGWISSNAHITNIAQAAQEGFEGVKMINPSYSPMICISQDESRITSVDAVTIKG